MYTYWAHPDNPGKSLHFKVSSLSNLIPSITLIPPLIPMLCNIAYLQVLGIVTWTFGWRGGGHYSAYCNCVFQTVFWGTPVESDSVRKSFHGETCLGNAAYHHLVLELHKSFMVRKPGQLTGRYSTFLFLKETDNMRVSTEYYVLRLLWGLLDSGLCLPPTRCEILNQPCNPID